MPGLESVIKVDQLFQAIDKAVDDSNPLILAKVVSEQTLQDLARAIASHHKPASINWAAKFGLQPPARNAQAAPRQAAMAPLPPDAPRSTARPSDIPAAPTPTSSRTPAAPPAPEKPAREYRCHGCAAVVEQKVARFCWFNKPRFGGNIYCLDCQQRVAG